MSFLFVAHGVELKDGKDFRKGLVQTEFLSTDSEIRM